MNKRLNKRKIVNDPVYGFISIPNDFIFDLIEHPFFQRLRHIKQLGLTHLVYPGALHTRFHHALGAMHLMCEAIEVLRQKGHLINEEEAEAVTIAILLHDIGHGPFSHALENSLVDDIKHEDISEFFMYELNNIFQGKIKMALKIFKNTYHKKFLHQLVSSQLDVDRLDYLNRDSFYTGVSEGVIGSERIIKMLNVVNDELVVEAKGIYSIEKFIIARRLMYWQVYLHKTVVSAEFLLINILRRAKFLIGNGVPLFCTPALNEFLKNKYNKNSFLKNNQVLSNFSRLDDYDIYASVKVWCDSPDKTLAMLSKRLIFRNLFRIEFSNTPFDEEKLHSLREKVIKAYDLDSDEAKFFVFTDKATNNIYNLATEKIKILLRNNDVLDISEASDYLDNQSLSKTVVKYFLCYPKDI
ncbi:MAG: HD domain-containing protein [Bacteroidales bacterium]|nr:HD domain-containing protein [Bacteroidales bacterium]